VSIEESTKYGFRTRTKAVASVLEAHCEPAVSEMTGVLVPGSLVVAGLTIDGLLQLGGGEGGHDLSIDFGAAEDYPLT
jgi:hypothetical protein